MTSENKAKKAYLNRYRWDVEKLKEIDDEIAACRLGALPGSPSFDGMPHGSASNTDLSDYAAKIDELLMEFKRIREKALQDLKEISLAIEAMGDEYARSNILLRYRYIQLKSWEEIGRAMNFHEVYVKRELHSIALEQFKIP